MDEIYEHRDRMGRLLKTGDCVAYPTHNSLSIGTIKKLNPKMVKVVPVGIKFGSWANKYPQDLVLLDGPEVTMYFLKMNTDG
jgi:hypothetical protein